MRCEILLWNRAIERSDCFHTKGHESPCKVSSNPYMIAFGVVEILFSQIPDFDQIWWLSIVAAVMSFTYSTIGLGLGIAKVVGMSSQEALYFTLCANKFDLVLNFHDIFEVF